MERLLYIGAYAHAGEPGIRAVRLGADGTLTPVSEYREMENPSYLTRGPGNRLYAVSETLEGGEVRAFDVGDGGALQPINRRSVSGGAACHVAVNRAGDVLSVSNYLSGIVDVFRLEPDGSIAGRISTLSHAGSGPNRERQEGPHAHFAAFHPLWEDLMLAVDLGSDRIWLYRIDRERRAAAPAGDIPLPPGSGPRHLVFCPDAQEILYVVCELGLCVYTVRFDGRQSEIIGRQSCVPEGFAGIAGSAAIKADPEGRRVYVSTRAYNGIPGEDCVACCNIDPATHNLTEPRYIHGMAAEPRDIALVDGFLIVACQSGGKLMSFPIDRRDGRAGACAGMLEIPGACCICK